MCIMHWMKNIWDKGDKMGNIDELFEEYNITKKEQKEIMAVMEKYRTLIADGRKVSHVEYEKDIYSIFGGYILASRHTPAIGYHFCEYVAKAFMEDRRWKEVFQVLYGDFVKYGGKIE